MGGLYFICVSVLWISNRKSKILGVQIVGQYLYLRIPDILLLGSTKNFNISNSTVNQERKNIETGKKRYLADL